MTENEQPILIPDDLPKPLCVDPERNYWTLFSPLQSARMNYEYVNALRAANRGLERLSRKARRQKDEIIRLERSLIESQIATSGVRNRLQLLEDAFKKLENGEIIELVRQDNTRAFLGTLNKSPRVGTDAECRH